MSPLGSLLPGSLCSCPVLLLLSALKKLPFCGLDTNNKGSRRGRRLGNGVSWAGKGAGEHGHLFSLVAPSLLWAPRERNRTKPGVLP